MNIDREKFKIVVREPQWRSTGICVTKEAFIELDTLNMRNDFVNMFVYYHKVGAIRVKVASVEPAEVAND